MLWFRIRKAKASLSKEQDAIKKRFVLWRTILLKEENILLETGGIFPQQYGPRFPLA